MSSALRTQDNSIAQRSSSQDYNVENATPKNTQGRDEKCCKTIFSSGNMNERQSLNDGKEMKNRKLNNRKRDILIGKLSKR